MSKLDVITTFFNPSGFKSLLRNYYLFRERIEKQNVNLLTVELSFNGKFEIQGDNVYRLTSNSVMWQKERLINYGISQLPPNTECFGWFDCDIFVLNDDWVDECIDKLKTCDILQPFKKVFFAPKNETTFSPFYNAQQSVTWQYKTHKDWLNRRISKELPFSCPGFAWCAKTSLFKDIGIYDKNIIGSGDTMLVDCLLGSWKIHGYAEKFNNHMKSAVWGYANSLIELDPVVDHLPNHILHLYHGSIKNRQYMDRHSIIHKYDFDPYNDIKLVNNVYEWNSNKFDMHEEIRRYFYDRKEDE